MPNGSTFEKMFYMVLQTCSSATFSSVLNMERKTYESFNICDAPTIHESLGKPVGQMITLQGSKKHFLTFHPRHKDGIRIIQDIDAFQGLSSVFGKDSRTWKRVFSETRKHIFQERFIFRLHLKSYRLQNCFGCELDSNLSGFNFAPD
jgi:hypothetical protein